MRRRRLFLRGLVSIVALMAPFVYCACAQASFSPFALVSGDPAAQLQADYAYDPAVSAEGNYVAYTGSIASQKGIFRTDLTTGEEQTVALGEDSGAPSISADGRYVSFTTNDNPATGEAPKSTSEPAGECDSVYVRDMSKAPQEAGAYTLVSARDESSESLIYAPPTPSFQSCGAASASRVAISADGSEVAFTVLSKSDLTGPCSATEVADCTPEDQVAVRNLDTRRTTLVSVTQASLDGTPQPVPSGAALAGKTVGGLLGSAHLPIAASTAAISADGSTVAWMGIDVAEQVPITAPLKSFDEFTEEHSDSYAEPLWRRITEGPTAPTRRVLAGDDPTASGCPPECSGGLDLEWDLQNFSEAGGYTGAAPAYGSYVERATSSFAVNAGLGNPIGAVTPQLSSNGMIVALLSTQPNFGDDPNFGLESSQGIPPANAFVVNMNPGLTRAQSITRLTEWGSISESFRNTTLDGSITSIAISPDGSRVVFTTERSDFPLSPPALITPPVSQVKTTQLYEANLAGDTLALVSLGYNGQPASGAVFGAALSGNGGTLALASEAGNLAFGAVSKGSDVFVTHEEESPTVDGVQSVTPLPLPSDPALPWRISATATPSADGALTIDVAVPGAGSLVANASSSIPITETVVSHAHRSAKARKAKARKVTVIATRQVAHTATTAENAGLIQIRLTPTSHYRSLTYGKGGLYATITLTFTELGHPRLTETMQASFVGRLSKPASSHIKRKAEKPAKRGRK